MFPDPFFYLSRALKISQRQAWAALVMQPDAHQKTLFAIFCFSADTTTTTVRFSPVRFMNPLFWLHFEFRSKSLLWLRKKAALTLTENDGQTQTEERKNKSLHLHWIIVVVLAHAIPQTKKHYHSKSALTQPDQNK